MRDNPRDQRPGDTNQAIEGNLPRPSGRLLRCVTFSFDERSLANLDRMVEQGHLAAEDRDLFRRLAAAQKRPVIVTPDVAAASWPVPGEWPDDETAADVQTGGHVA